jgi:hypothetical protein
MGVQVIALAFAYCRKRQLEDRVDDPDLQDSSKSTLLESGGAPASRSERASAAQKKYRDKKPGMYAKYEGVIKR